MNIKKLLMRVKQAVMLFKEVKNPISSYLFYIGIKNNVTIKSKKIGDFTFNKDQKSIYNAFLLTLPYLKKENENECKSFFNQCLMGKNIIELKDFKVTNNKCEIFAEKWDEFPYNFKNVKHNDIIIDIGSNVGDTALEFVSMWDDVTVYGFEPVKELYEISLENIKLNPKYENKIKCFNYAVSYKKGTITIDSMESAGGYIGSDESYVVDVITINDILKMFDITPKFLKMDCEGCEFDIIKNTDLSMFDEIIFEHHASFKNENYKVLVDLLQKQGFQTEVISLWSFNVNDIGIIHAFK